MDSANVSNISTPSLCNQKKENSLLDKQIKASNDLIIGDNEALKLEKARVTHCCFKAILKRRFRKSFEFRSNYIYGVKTK
jgi:hypothetical protein